MSDMFPFYCLFVAFNKTSCTNELLFPPLSVVGHVSRKRLTRRITCATPVTGVNPAAPSLVLCCPVAACRQTGCPPGCLGQTTSVEENHTAQTNSCQPVAGATTATPGKGLRAQPKPARPAWWTSTAGSTHSAARTSRCRKPP